MLITSHLNHLTLAGYRPRTIESRKDVLGAFERHLHPRPLTDATRMDCEAFLARPLALTSRRAYRSHLRAFYAWCVDEQLISSDPTAKIPPIRVPQAMPRPIAEADLARALACSTGRMRCWLLLMSLAGLRCVEVANLRPTDLIAAEVGTLLYLRECKGGGSATVPGHPDVLSALAAMPVRNGLWWDVNANTVSREVSVFLASLGIMATAHMLRHYAGTAWYRQSGHDLLTTARLLRHHSVQTTQGYAELDPTRPAQVVKLVVLPPAWERPALPAG